MSGVTKIEWTRGDDGSSGVTWNPVTGCTRVSEGCGMPRWEGDLVGGCYAETFAERWRGIPGHPFEQGFDVRLWPDRLGQPLRWRKPKRVFVNSMSDLFMGPERVPDAFLAAVWATMYWTSSETCGWPSPNNKPVHTYQILTKRPGPMRAWLARWADPEQRRAMLAEAQARGWADPDDVEYASCMPPVLPNVWLGVSVELERWAQVRLPILADVQAVVRFASCEPLLGPLDLRPWLGAGLDWVIVGGESGSRARPMHPQWALDLRDQCVAAEVPYFFKQHGEWVPGSRPSGSSVGEAVVALDGTMQSPPHALWATTGPANSDRVNRMGWAVVHRAGKKAAGRLLDGRTWDQFPERLRQ